MCVCACMCERETERETEREREENKQEKKNKLSLTVLYFQISLVSFDCVTVLIHVYMSIVGSTSSTVLDTTPKLAYLKQRCN